MMQAPVTVLQANTKRDTGKKAQYGNIMAGKVRPGPARLQLASRRLPLAACRSNAAVRLFPSRSIPFLPLSCQAVADIVRTTLGPRAMLKMLLDANGGIVLTNDGNAILREIDVSHPAAKSIIELSRTQDEEVRQRIA